MEVVGMAWAPGRNIVARKAVSHQPSAVRKSGRSFTPPDSRWQTQRSQRSARTAGFEKKL